LHILAERTRRSDEASSEVLFERGGVAVSVHRRRRDRSDLRPLHVVIENTIVKFPKEEIAS
jgi:hypothetical protein